MGILSKQEREELLRVAASKTLWRDLQRIKRLSGQARHYSLQEYIRFLTVTNRLVNHSPKRFVKMTGDNFKL